MIWPSKWRHLKGLSDIMALASLRRDDPGDYPTSPLFATEPVVDYEPEFMSLEDQLEEAANLIAELGRFRFLCRPALREGEVSQSVIPVTIEHVDRDEWTGDYHVPNPQRIREVCSILAAQSGIPASAVRK